MSQLIDKLAWIYLRDRKILCTRSKGKDKYYIPGGKREAGETDHQALTREISEELSVTLIPDTISYMETFQAQAHGKGEGVLVQMTCYQADYDGELQCASEIEELIWFTHRDWEKCSQVDKLIFDWLKEQNLLD